MNCTQIQNQLGLYMDGVLDGKMYQDMEEHLASCVECTKELDALRQTGSLLSMIHLEEPPDRVRHAVMAGLEDHSLHRKPLIPVFPRWIAAGAAALALLGILIWPRPAPPEMAENNQTMLVQHVAAGWDDPFVNRSALAIDLQAQP